jgi:hypothetical protein
VCEVSHITVRYITLPYVLLHIYFVRNLPALQTGIRFFITLTNTHNFCFLIVLYPFYTFAYNSLNITSLLTFHPYLGLPHVFFASQAVLKQNRYELKDTRWGFFLRIVCVCGGGREEGCVQSVVYLW